tara:strand:+ start:494 stop:739 length:246 start_codon:yes stop_codon:yes gene_type:complete
MKPIQVILSMPLHNLFSNHVNPDLSRVSQANGDVYQRAVVITYQMALKRTNQHVQKEPTTRIQGQLTPAVASVQSLATSST